MYDKVLDAGGQNTIEQVFALAEPDNSIPPNQPDYLVQPSKERLVSFVAEVTDPNTAKVVAGLSTNVVHITDGYVGVNSAYWVDKNAKVKASGIVLDLDAQPKSGAKVKAQLIHQEWNSVKKLGVDGIFYNEYELQKTLETTETMTSSKDGRFNLEFTPKQGGEYIIRTTYTGANGANYISESFSYVSTDSLSIWNNGNNSVTDLIAEKSILEPGETAVFTLKSPVKTGKIFVAVEKDDQILDAWITDITGYAQKIEVPVQKMHIPNVYVRVYLIGKDDPKGLPVFKRALSQIKVLPDSQKLAIQVTTPKKTYAPGESLSVDVLVKDAEGKPVQNAVGTLSVVDESVLALMGNPIKNPFAFFYDMKRYLGTTMYVSLLNLVEKLEVKNTNNGEKGGAGEGNKGGDTKKKRGIFKDTAFWTGEFTTDAQGHASIDIGKLPDNLTTWDIEAILSTAKTQIGIATTTITTEQRVMINDNFPRFIRT